MTWGGARAGAGRPARGSLASEPHQRRPVVSARHPVHVTARMARALAALTHAKAFQALRRAVSLSLAREDFRIVQLAVLGNRVELVVEASDKLALAKGMQGFQVSAARSLNRKARRVGSVFPDRYRMRILRTRVAVRNVVGGLPLVRTKAWPETWLMRVERVMTRERHVDRYAGDG